MSREAKTEHRVRRILKLQGYDNPQKIIDAIRNDIPNVRLPKVNNNDTYKFLEGITRMYTSNQLTSADIIMQINQILPFVSDESHVDEYDYDLNGLSAQQLIDRFKITVHQNRILEEQKSRKELRVRNLNYNIVKINSTKEASKYKDYTSWCINTSQNMYNSYTSDGLGCFYFIVKNGFENIKRPEYTDNCLDEYGLSLIAVSVTMDGSLNTCTCRYNHDCGGNDSVMNREQIEELIGMSFFDAFPGRTKEELRKMGVSDWLGRLYTDPKSGKTGIVVRVDENDNPKTLMSPQWIQNPKDGSYEMNWYDAMEAANKDGWHLPSREELDQIIKFKNIINARIQEYNDKLEAEEDC